MFKLIIVLSCLISPSFCNRKIFSNCEVEVIPLPVEVGILDSAFYDCEKENLYFSDLFGQNIFSYNEKTKEISVASIPDYPAISFLISNRNCGDQFIIGVNDSVHLIQWDSESDCPKVLQEVFSLDSEGHSTNHAIAGPNGDIYTGLLSPSLCGASAENGFYRYSDGDAEVECLPGSYKTTNSLGFDYKTNTLYRLDGCQQELKSFKVNPKTGNLYKEKTIKCDFGLPDSAAPVGLSVLNDGTLIIGSYKAGYLFAVDPSSGEIIDKFKMPTKYITDNTFGGGCTNRNVLYVLTAALDVDITTGEDTNKYVKPPGGSLLIVRGLPFGQAVMKPVVET